MELIDKSILYFAINEMLFGVLDKPVTIDESLRLSKSFQVQNLINLLMQL